MHENAVTGPFATNRPGTLAKVELWHMTINLLVFIFFSREFHGMIKSVCKQVPRKRCYRTICNKPARDIGKSYFYFLSNFIEEITKRYTHIYLQRLVHVPVDAGDVNELGCH